MSDRPDLDEAAKILHAGGFKITGGKYAPVDPKTGTRPTLGTDSRTVQSNVELSDILNDIENYKYSKYGVSLQFIETAILALFQSQQQQLLKGLMEQMPDDSIVATKYGYHSREKKYGFRMGVHEAKSVIQNKLEGMQ